MTTLIAKPLNVIKEAKKSAMRGRLVERIEPLKIRRIWMFKYLKRDWGYYPFFKAVVSYLFFF